MHCEYFLGMDPKAKQQQQKSPVKTVVFLLAINV